MKYWPPGCDKTHRWRNGCLVPFLVVDCHLVVTWPGCDKVQGLLYRKDYLVPYSILDCHLAGCDLAWLWQSTRPTLHKRLFGTIQYIGLPLVVTWPGCDKAQGLLYIKDYLVPYSILDCHLVVTWPACDKAQGLLYTENTIWYHTVYWTATWLRQTLLCSASWLGWDPNRQHAVQGFTAWDWWHHPLSHLSLMRGEDLLRPHCMCGWVGFQEREQAQIHGQVQVLFYSNVW
jgi:hypothetical protein